MMANQKVSVYIKGKSHLEIAGLTALLSNFPGIHVIPYDKDSPPDVLIWDYQPDQLLNDSVLTARTALLILINEPLINLPSIECTGLLSKNESPETLAAAIRQVARGEQYISPSLALSYLESIKPRMREMQDSPLEALSEREQEILDLLAQGQSNKSIAGRLYLSIRTVEGHIARIYAKLGVHSRTEAMLVAIETR